MNSTHTEAETYRPSGQSYNLPEMVANEFDKLPQEQRKQFLQEYKRRKKSVFIGFIFWIFACHYAYVGKWGVQLLCWVTFGGLGLWWGIDFFRLYGIISNFNKDVAVSTMRDLKIINTPNIDVKSMAHLG